MTFLQPFILYALPLIGLPILIHFVNQNRYRSVHWAATMFLLQARRMVTGIARLRYLLILLARMMVIAGLLFAVSRPMSGGWLGMTAGGAPDTTIIVLDRSASMEESDPVTGLSKRQTSLQKLAELLRNVGSATQLVLFDSATGQPLKLNSARDLTDLPQIEATSTAADIPLLLQSAAEYTRLNQTGRTDIWVCSDLRESDWHSQSGRWEAIRSQLQDHEGVRFFLLSYPEVTSNNLSVSAAGIHRRESSDGAELVMDLKITRTSESTDSVRVPVTFVIDGARSTVELEITGPQLLKNGHAIPLDRAAVKGWGRIELPADTNPSDNVFSFVYGDTVVRRTVIISDDPATAEFFRIAAATSPAQGIVSDAQIISPSQTAAISWKDTSLIIWQAPLPVEPAAGQLRDFAALGRSILFFPPAAPDSTAIFGMRWDDWQQIETDQPATITRWRTDADLLSNSRSGAPLPVGQLELKQFCRAAVAVASASEETQDKSPESGQADSSAASTRPAFSAMSEMSVLAQADGGVSLLTRAVTDQGGVYFCGILPGSSHSNLVSNGVVFYVMIQRCLAQGAGSLSAARQLVCSNDIGAVAAEWEPLDPTSKALLLSRRALNSGVYRSDDVLFALNRPESEDDPEVLSDRSLSAVFGELNYTRIDDQTGSTSDLANEIWRLFLLIMIASLLAEALLCLPEKADRQPKPFRVPG